MTESDDLIKYMGTIRRHVTQLVRERHDDIDDYVQETMLQAHRWVRDHGPPHHPKGWLCKIAKRVVQEGSEKIRRRQTVEVELDDQHGSVSFRQACVAPANPGSAIARA